MGHLLRKAPTSLVLRAYCRDGMRCGLIWIIGHKIGREIKKAYKMEAYFAVVLVTSTI